ncbi:MAG: aa3-type cytochrome c oxidase subunit IV [Sphingomonas sp.]|nr:aa3-type cytochrome c oxidase subunit IV [Sphingomonas sp.]
MANEGAADQGGASPATEHGRTEDFEAHARDYSGFIKMFKWLAIISFLTAMFVMFIIS